MENQETYAMLINILTLCAILVGPIFAVLIGHHLQDRSKKREEKMNIFKSLMLFRDRAWLEPCVQAMNMIDVVFSDSTRVRNAWKQYREEVKVVSLDSCDPDEIQKKRRLLLEAISNDIGYKGISWETIHDPPYVPDTLSNSWKLQSQFQAMSYEWMSLALQNLKQCEENKTVDQSQNITE